MSTTPTCQAHVFALNSSQARVVVLGVVLLVGLAGVERPAAAQGVDPTTKVFFVSPCNEGPFALFQLKNSNETAITIDYTAGATSGSVTIQTAQTQEITLERGSFVSFFYNGNLFRQMPTNDQYCDEIPNPETKIYVNGICSNSTNAMYNIINNNDVDVDLTIIAGEYQTTLVVQQNSNTNATTVALPAEFYYYNKLFVALTPVTTSCGEAFIPPQITSVGDCYDDVHAYYIITNVDTHPVSFAWKTSIQQGQIDLEVGGVYHLQTNPEAVNYYYQGVLFYTQPLPTTRCEEPPGITSPATATFTAGVPGSFTVTTTGWPTPGLSEDGALPRGVTFTDNSDGTATLAGTPLLGAGSSYPLVITASNGVSPDATQGFTLTVLGWARTTLSLLSSRNPAPRGYPVRFTARVAFYTRLAGVPTGTMEFWVDGTPQAPPVRLASAQASSQPVTFTTAGPHTVLAKYSGDRNFAAATATLTQTVDP